MVFPSLSGELSGLEKCNGQGHQESLTCQAYCISPYYLAPDECLGLAPSWNFSSAGRAPREGQGDFSKLRECCWRCKSSCFSAGENLGSSLRENHGTFFFLS